MKGFRTWNRRDFSITPNGYFTVLKSDGWFPTVRLPGGFRYRVGQSKAPDSAPSNQIRIQSTAATLSPEWSSQPALNDPALALSQATSRLQILPQTTDRPSLLRPVLIALAATAIAFLLLCWIAWPLLRGYLASKSLPGQ